LQTSAIQPIERQVRDVLDAPIQAVHHVPERAALYRVVS
jgi:hypothetical protein